MALTQSNLEKVIIRPMEAGDIGAIFDIDRVLTGENRAVALTDLVSEDPGGPLDLSFVADVNGQVMGFLLARHAYIGEPVVDAGLIQGVGIHPLYQKRGLAGQLVQALVKKARSRKIKTLRVMLRGYDSIFEGFFSKMDFHKTPLIVYDRVLSK